MCRAQPKGAQDGTACSSSDARAPLLHTDTVEQSLEDGLTEVRDFQGLLATRPKQVIKWLQENGMEKLGEFEVQVCMCLQLCLNMFTVRIQSQYAVHAGGQDWASQHAGHPARKSMLTSAHPLPNPCCMQASAHRVLLALTKMVTQRGARHVAWYAQDSLFYAAASDETGLVTAGAQERHLPDYERFWREYLASRSSRSRRMSPGALAVQANR